MASRAVFVPTGDPGGYDLMVDQRIREYDVRRVDFRDAVRRARLAPGTGIYVRDDSGQEEKIG